MKTKYALICLLLINFCALNLSSQTKLVEKVTKKGNELVIPYEKYVLSNGLTVIIHEDHSDPIVYVDVTYHVGSAREQEGRSGFAHFFEHMMFQGSDNVKDEEHFKIVSEAGGTLNGSTTYDRTNYYQVLPSNQLEVAMWLEADRMGFLLDSVTQKKFEVQRATVKNERGQNYDNKPYGLVFEKISAALYPSSHPYSWLPIGYVEDLNRVDVNDLKKFFLRWYGPNNAVLTVAGDVNPAEVIKMAEKYYGSIPKGPAVTAQKLPIPVLDKDRYVSYEDNIRSPQLVFAFPTVAGYDADEPALDVLADIIGGNKSSIFYQNFVKPQSAQFASAFHSTSELGGGMYFMIRAMPDKSLTQIDSMVRASLLQFEKRGVTDDDIKKYQSNFESQMINSLSSVQGKGSMLAAYQTLAGNANYFTKEMERYNKVTKEDVMRVYNKYLKGKGAVVLSVCPKGKPQAASKPDNFTYPKTQVAPEAAEYKGLTYVKAKDNFDRSKKPAPGANPIIKAPDFWKDNFENGLKIIGAKSDEIPTVTIQINFESGHRYEPIEQAGMSELMTSMMEEGTTKHSAEEISEMLEKLGSDISIYNDGNDIVMYISSLTKNIDATLAIAQEMLFEPKFDEKDFERVKKQNLEAIENRVTSAVTIANNVFARLLYGDKHINGISSLGNKETISKITLDDVKNYYKGAFSSSLSTMVIVGDVSKEQILPKMAFLKKLPQHITSRKFEPAKPEIDKTKIYFVNKEKAPQSEIRIGFMSLPYDATGDYYKATIMNFPLGGAFNSRINLNLREVHGFTYGARSRFSGGKFAGPYTGSAGVRANATDSSVVEFMKEIKNYVDNGITAEELAFTKSSIGQSEALKYETAQSKAGFIKRILDYELDKSFTDVQSEILKSITKEEINAIAKQQINYNKMVILVVGDKTQNFDKLSKLGYDLIELDADGNPVNKVQPPVEEKSKEAVPYEKQKVKNVKRASELDKKD